MTLGLWAILCLLSGLSSAQAAAPALQFFEAEYDLHFLGMRVATVKRSLQADSDGRYVFRAESETSGMLSLFRDDQIREYSLFALNQGQVILLKSAYHHTGSQRQKHEEISFDWDAMQAHSLRADQPWTIPIPPHTLDLFVSQMQLMLDLQNGKQDFNYAIVRKGELDYYRLRQVGEELIDTPVGYLKTLKFIQQAKNKERYTMLWCAPDLHYFPVRIEHREPGDEPVRAELQSVKFYPVEAKS